MSVLDKIHKKDLEEYAGLCLQFADFDLDEFLSEVRLSIDYRKHQSVTANKYIRVLENKWYESLKTDSPDFSVYNDIEFLADMWVCWITCSRLYLKRIAQQQLPYGFTAVSGMRNIRTVLDLGCGMGYTTAALTEMFPGATVYGTNLSNTIQWEICTEVAKKYNFKLVDTFVTLPKIDVIFASEYFEHFAYPIAHLDMLLRSVEPNYLIIQNSFNVKATGHFPVYFYGNKPYQNSKMSRIFNTVLRNDNYEKQDTGYWNDKPSYWKKRGI